ncbi:toxin [Salmonella enterica subsp. enterica]|uniref:Toxin n=1 Tax=Salmonella enterica subsp. enterica serovar Aqua TaxID=1302615 RepID=A0A5X6ESG5_SALET|nr:toxin [Salmonella enterica subsp. enterica serovar Bareilly]ECA3795566.1 toxin [Salmonella enterica subsp. enterica serovar Aqua]ECC9721833.1 toxin [Salmonella enterica subsp. diarizonae]EJM2521920.1 toxin [Salmonella enterica]HCM8928446.1 toxin [Salmonella enterica subsp. enterica serovar Paratyphi B]
MNKSIFIFTCMMIISGCSSTNNNQSVFVSSGSDLSDTENGSLFSIRNIQSGFMIENILDQKGQEQSGWQLIQQETPAEVLAITPGGWVQFKDPVTQQCLNAPGGMALSKGTCDIKNKESLFILIPSTTGAVQIKSVYTGNCILDKNNTDHFTFGKCIADFRQPQLIVPPKNLWMLNPPVTPSPPAPVTL